MSWSILITDSVQSDLDRFDDPAQVLSEIFDWATTGPPCDRRRGIGPAVIYEDVLQNGVKVQYFIGTSPHAYVAVIGIKAPLTRPPL